MRANAAKRVWQKLHQQLPRLNLPTRTIGRAIRATVIACMISGQETREHTEAQIPRFRQTPNRVVRGNLTQRRNMRNDQFTMADLYEKLGLKDIQHYINDAQSRNMGHLARRLEGRLEKRFLSFTLAEAEGIARGRKTVPNTRRELWTRVCEVMK